MIDTLAKNILNLDHSVLSVAVISTRGETLLSKTKFNINDVFAISIDKKQSKRDRIFECDAGVWTRAALEMTRQFERVFGGTDALVTFYKNVKMVILPIDNIKVHVVIICLRSTSTEVIVMKFNEFLKNLKKMDLIA